MNFLIYIEHAAENLQFYLWYRDYVRRFSELPSSEQGLAPVWTVEQEERAIAAQSGPGVRTKKGELNEMFRGTDFDPRAKSTPLETGRNPFNTPPRTPNVENDSLAPSSVGWTDGASTAQSVGPRSFKKKAADAFDAAGHLQPCECAETSRAYMFFDNRQLPSDRSKRKYHASSPFMLRMVVLASSICLLRNAMSFWKLCRRPPILARSEELLERWNGLCAIKPTLISSVGQSAMEIDRGSSLPVVWVLEALSPVLLPQSSLP